MSVTIRYHTIIKESEVDGPGRRAALFVQGCPIRCPGCQSPHLWDAEGGHEATVEEIAGQLLATGRPVTISGGEPFAQAEALAALVSELRATDPAIHILIYTGFTLEDLQAIADATPGVNETLAIADALVDGPYIARLDHDGMQWRGSSNQRPINLVATRATGWQETVTLDWDTPQVIITEAGNLLAAADFADLFFNLGVEAKSRRCGQTTN